MLDECATRYDSTRKKSENGLLTFPFDVKGQKGEIPRIGLGTATLSDGICTSAVRTAIQAGYRHIDTALLYDNQEAVGKAIAQCIAAKEVTREELFVTSKVAFYPAAADGKNTWVPLSFHDCNKKGGPQAKEAIELCLQKLGLDYVDLMLIHNPATDLDEYQASCCPHFFELAKSDFTQEERAMILQSRLDKVKYDEAMAEASRADSWKALEAARDAGKCRYIGVSNYPPLLMRAMERYAAVMPCVNQLELHPRFSSPELRALAQQSGFVLTGYGSGNSTSIEKSQTIKAIGNELGVSPVAVVLRWTLQHGIVVIPRTSTKDHIEENLTACTTFELSESQMSSIDALNEDHPYYWSPVPLLPPGTRLYKKGLHSCAERAKS